MNETSMSSESLATPIRVLLVDDHEMVRIGLRLSFEPLPDITVVGEASSGEEALDLAALRQPDVVLMDINMEGMGGLEATHRLHKQHPEIRIIVITVHGGGPFPKQLLDAGALGYLTKSAQPDEIANAVRQVFHGERYLASDVAERLAFLMLDESDAPMSQVSRRELQALMMIIQGFNNETIAEHLCLSPKTVSTYRSRLCRKLDAKNNVQLLRSALENGIMEPSPDRRSAPDDVGDNALKAG